MMQPGDARYRSSDLRRDLRENLKLATAVLMVVHQDLQDQVREQVREYLQAATKRPEQPPGLDICHLDDRTLDFLGFHLPEAYIRQVTGSDIAHCACAFAWDLSA